MYFNTIVMGEGRAEEWSREGRGLLPSPLEVHISIASVFLVTPAFPKQPTMPCAKGGRESSHIRGRERVWSNISLVMISGAHWCGWGRKAAIRVLP